MNGLNGLWASLDAKRSPDLFNGNNPLLLMTDLSPQAQAVLDAALQYEINPECYSREIAAAALEAAADRVVPFTEITPQKNLEGRRDAMVWGMQHQTQLTRQQLLAIAAELRGDTTTTQENN